MTHTSRPHTTPSPARPHDRSETPGSQGESHPFGREIAPSYWQWAFLAAEIHGSFTGTARVPRQSRAHTPSTTCCPWPGRASELTRVEVLAARVSEASSPLVSRAGSSAHTSKVASKPCCIVARFDAV